MPDPVDVSLAFARLGVAFAGLDVIWEAAAVFVAEADCRWQVNETFLRGNFGSAG